MPHKQLMEDRLRFLNIDQSTLSEIQKARDIIEPAMDEMLDKFYSHLLGEPELGTIFFDQDEVSRARLAQKKHWLEALFTGRYDNAYYEKTSQIGRAHARVGLTPNWYIGGYNQMLCQFIELISNKCAETNKSAVELIQAVSKIIFLDMDLVMHCYLDAKDHSMLRMLQHSTDFRAQMWKFSDDLNAMSAQIKSTIELLSAGVEGGKSSNKTSAIDNSDDIIERINVLLTQAKQMEKRTLDLDGHLRKLPLSDKLYIPEQGKFSRLKAWIFGKN